MLLFKIGLIINILVAGGFGVSLVNKRLHTKIYGMDNTSRQILSSLYLAIAIISIVALINENYLKNIVLILFPFQIIYKFLTVFLILDKRSPILWSNLIIGIYLSLVLYLNSTY
jgi:hypothetical protein